MGCSEVTIVERRCSSAHPEPRVITNVIVEAHIPDIYRRRGQNRERKNSK
jgi:hypothetical protein